MGTHNKDVMLHFPRSESKVISILEIQCTGLVGIKRQRFFLHTLKKKRFKKTTCRRYTENTVHQEVGWIYFHMVKTDTRQSNKLSSFPHRNSFTQVCTNHLTNAQDMQFTKLQKKKLHENLFFFGKITKYKQIEKNLVQKNSTPFCYFQKKSIRPEMFLRTVSRIKDFEEIFLFRDITGASGGGNPKPKFH